MADDNAFPRLVSLACHDLRTPLATVSGFAKTLTRNADLGEPASRYVTMIETAAAQMAELLDELGVAARIEGNRYEPALRETDTLELALAAAKALGPERVAVSGQGAPVQVDLEATRRFLANKVNELLIAYVDGEPAGFVSATELTHPDHAQPELFLNELGVVEAHRGHGIGRALVQRLWEIARERGCRGMWVLTDDDNVAANRVYAAAGGTRAGAEVMYQWGEG
jgi:ribosomal protein S18 acetylase RimI-like enzyme